MIEERHAIRALLLTPQEELLLIRFIEPKSKRAFWLTPGGGMMDGESVTECLRREVHEETGLVDFKMGLEVWRRDHAFSWDGRTVRQRERYYLIKVERFEPVDHHQPDEIEQAAFDGYRWWRTNEIEQSNELFVPSRLAVLLKALLENGPPASPIDVGV